MNTQFDDWCVCVGGGGGGGGLGGVAVVDSVG